MGTRWIYGLMVGWFLIAPLPAWAYEAITEFDSEININQDTSLSITETINYETDEEHHGIYRYIPLEYRVNGQIVKAPIDQIEVTDETGRSLQFSRSNKNKSIELKIGDPETTFTGNKTYIISYRVEDAIKQFPDHDELYWDITGEGWKIPIQKVSANVNSPYAQINKIACYAGLVGGDNGLCQTKFTQDTANFIYKQTVNYNDNVTTVVGLEKNNQLIFPSSSQKFIKSLRANWWIPLIFFPMIFMAAYWYKNGRDYVFISPNVFDLNPDKPRRKKSVWGDNRIPFVYEPLTDLTPGEAGAIMDEKVDNQDVIAEIIDLARKKYISIQKIEKKGLFGQNDYVFKKLPNTKSLPKHQDRLLKGLFANNSIEKAVEMLKKEMNANTLGVLKGPLAWVKEMEKTQTNEIEVTTLSTLKGSFYTTMLKVKQDIEDGLTSRKLYVQNPRTSRGIGLALPIAINVLIFLMIGGSLEFVQSISWYVIFAIQALISLALGYNSTQKTAIGSNLAMQAKGLKKTITTGKWREEIKEKNLFIEEVLPFAIALGVVKKLAADMKDLNIQPPDYFHDSTINAMAFNSFVSDFSSQASSNLAYNPSSHSSSGGSGFSGGSSGGGGGGGGGGSW